MTSNEIKKIIDGLDIPEETQIFYEIKEITKKKYGYIVDYWQRNEKNYKNHKVMAVLVSKKMLDSDVVVFWDEGVVIDECYIPYDEIIFVGKCDFFHGEKFENTIVICPTNHKISQVLAHQKTLVFACDIIEKIIEKDNGLYDNSEKIKYYLNLYVRIEDTPIEEKILKVILYKKIINLTQDPIWIKKLVEKFGYIEYKCKYTESEKKRKTEMNKGIAWIIKKDTSKLEQYSKMYENILSDCLPYLNLLQVCDQLQGYRAFIEIYYNMLRYASEIRKRVSDELIYRFNTVVSNLKDKIESGVIELPQKENLPFLAMIKHISDIYSGKIIDESKKEHMYTFLKNADKAFYWLNLYTKQAGCDNTIEYEDVMFSLADIYKYGIATIPADEYKMLECLKTAANHGSVKASKFLAEYYVNGSEEKDKWVQLARENGQRFKDKRSINEKMKEKVGLDITETADVVGTVAGIGRDVAGVFNSVRDTVGTIDGIATDYVNATAERKTVVRNIEREQLEHEQYIEGQRAKNMKAKAENMKTERKAKKDIAREERKNR